MEGQCTAPKCCGHCLSCLPVALTFDLVDRTRRQQPHEPYVPWWPANIDSPTLYFHLKRRAMEHLCREQARLAPYSDPAVWRASNTSAAAGACNSLLTRRGQHQLTLRLPTGCTNVTAADELELVAVFSLEPPMAPAAASATATPLLHLVQQQQPQQQPQQQHTVVRPRPRRPVPRPPTAAGHPAACPQQPQASMGLMANLSYQEQCHRAQLAAAWGPADTLPQLQAACQDAFVRPSWQHCDWQQQQQQQQRAQAQAQQLAAAGGASWPYSVAPQQRQEGWAYGSSLAALPCQPQLSHFASMGPVAAC